MIEMMEGICSFCGQIATVRARTKEEADTIATKQCNCDEGGQGRSRMMLKERVREVLLMAENESGMPQMSDENFKLCQDLADRVLSEEIGEVKMTIQGTSVKIKRTKHGVSFSREQKKTQEAVC